jgi:hypothetical protein
MRENREPVWREYPALFREAAGIVRRAKRWGTHGRVTDVTAIQGSTLRRSRRQRPGQSTPICSRERIRIKFSVIAPSLTRSNALSQDFGYYLASLT